MALGEDDTKIYKEFRIFFFFFAKKRNTGIENKCVATKGERRKRMNWEIRIDIHTPLILCVK